MHHRLDDRALFKILDCLVDLVELIGLEQTIERETALLVELNEPRDEQIRNRITLNNPSHCPAQEDSPDVNGHLGAERWCSDDSAYAPERHAVDGLSKSLGIAGALQREVGSGPGDLADRVYRVLLRRVHDMRRAKFRPELEALVADIDEDDLGAANNDTASSALSPTDPPPKMAIDEPAWGWSEFRTAPAPV